MITIKDISLAYQENVVLQNLSIDFEEKHTHGIVGLNGTGKTTLLKALYGLKSLQSGLIEINNTPLSKDLIAYLEAEPFFYPSITGKEYLGLFQNCSFDIEKWTQLFPLPLDEFIDCYSTGMRKKLALLRLFKQDKDILILDEPFNGLDMDACQSLSLLLNKFRGEKTIFITSHILDPLLENCDYIHVLNKQTIAKSYSRKDFDELKSNLFKEINEVKINIINDACRD